MGPAKQGSWRECWATQVWSTGSTLMSSSTTSELISDLIDLMSVYVSRPPPSHFLGDSNAEGVCCSEPENDLSLRAIECSFNAHYINNEIWP